MVVGAKRERKGGRGRMRMDGLDMPPCLLNALHGCSRLPRVAMMVDAHRSRKVRHEFGWHLPPFYTLMLGRKFLGTLGAHSSTSTSSSPNHSCILFITWTRKKPECPSRRRFKCRLWRKRGHHLLFLNSQLGGPRKKKKFEFQKT